MTNSRATGGKLQLLDEHVATGTEATYTYTPSPALNMLNKYAEIYVKINGLTTASLELRMKLNAKTDYNEQTLETKSTVLVGADIDANSSFVLLNANLITGASAFESKASISLMTTSIATMTISSKGTVPNIGFFSSYGAVGVDTGNTITSIEILTSTSTWATSTEILIYGLLR